MKFKDYLSEGYFDESQVAFIIDNVKLTDVHYNELNDSMQRLLDDMEKRGLVEIDKTSKEITITHKGQVFWKKNYKNPWGKVKYKK